MYFVTTHRDVLSQILSKSAHDQQSVCRDGKAEGFQKHFTVWLNDCCTSNRHGIV